jgi:hypothetical protein
MPKVNRSVLDVASENAVGAMRYLTMDVAKWKQFREMAGITKGQWKRYQCQLKQFIRTESGSYKTTYINVSEVAAKKLEVLCNHGDSPHLHTLLKMVEAQGDDHEQG